MPRNDLSNEEKKSLLHNIEQYPGYSQRQVSAMLGVPKSTIARLMSQKSVIENNNDYITQKRKRMSKDDEVDRALLQWFREARSRDISISGPLLKTKAEDLANQLGKECFVATEGWLGRWKRRNDICHKKAHGEKRDADAQEAGRWITTVLPEMLRCYPPQDVYNCDETGVYYRATPDGTLTFRIEALSGSKKAMDRITALVCANMTGCDRRPLLVIGKSRNPRCFKGISHLPVQYKSNANAWMTANIFTNWLKDWDLELCRQNRKILLVLDNCSAHPHVETNNIHLLYLPPNTTSIIQPMDQEIIMNLKTLYRKMVLQKIVHQFDIDNSPSFSAISLSRKLSLLSAVQMLATSWASVKRETFVNCFGQAGFSTIPLPTPEPVSNAFYEIDVGMIEEEFQAFCSVDSTVQCHTCLVEDDIVKSIVSSRETVEDIESEGSEDITPCVRCGEALEHVDKLWVFLSQNDSNKKARKAIEVLHDFVSMINNRRVKQTTILDFFANIDKA
jgi:transposase